MKVVSHEQVTADDPHPPVPAKYDPYISFTFIDWPTSSDGLKRALGLADPFTFQLVTYLGTQIVVPYDMS